MMIILISTPTWCLDLQSFLQKEGDVNGELQCATPPWTDDLQKTACEEFRAWKRSRPARREKLEKAAAQLFVGAKDDVRPNSYEITEKIGARIANDRFFADATALMEAAKKKVVS